MAGVTVAIVMIGVIVVSGLGLYGLRRKKSMTPGMEPAASGATGNSTLAGVTPQGAPLPEPAVTREEVETVERSKVIIHGLMLSVQETVESLVSGVSSYDDALARHKAAIQKAMTLAAVKEVERLMVEEVEAMQKSTEAYRVRLEAAEEKIKQQDQDMQRLSADASLDFLTKVPNRRTLDARLNEEFARFKRYGTMFSLIMLDVDHFKRVNDSLGHVAGDRILRAVATISQEQKRQNDFLGRFGGEEFALVLPETDLEKAMAAAEKIRRKIEISRFNYEGRPVQVTLSAGIAQVSSTDKEVTALLARADEALYRAKEKGRNRVEVGEGE
jgi:diguanylate cyclase